MIHSLNLLNKTLLQDKRVLVRGDLDVPLGPAQEILDASRLEALRETLDYLTIRDAKVILMGHLGRPEGKVVADLRMDPIASYLILKGYRVLKLNIIFGSDLYQAMQTAKPGDIVLLENLRFDPREEANDEAFGRDLASYADIYINECFATSHRVHSSIIQVPKFLPPYAGFRLERELENIKRVIENYEKPLVAIFGGVKIETKIPAISKFLALSDFVILGGKLGENYEGDNNYKILVPIDYVGDNKEDIGPKTINMFKNAIGTAKTIIWNGPMGKFEDEEFMEGTRQIAKAVVDSGAFSLVGGGDTIEALDKLKLRDKMGFVSMGGGAMLEFIASGDLPGLKALG